MAHPYSIASGGEIMKQKSYDVIVAGAGVGGVSAAVAAARAGAKVLLLEAAEVIGGTGVHSPVGLVCNFRDSNLRPINTGLHCEFFPEVYESPALFPAPEPWCGPALETYDHRVLLERYQRILAAEENLTVWTGTRVVEAETEDGQIQRVRTEGRESGWITASVWIDSTADGNLSALAGAEFQIGRDGDGALQPSTLTFGLTNIDFAKAGVNYPTDRLPNWVDMIAFNNAVSVVYREAKAAGEVDIPKDEVFGLPYPDRKSLLFNNTRVLGDYLLTAEDCLLPAQFKDMIAACAYMIDIHNPSGSGSRLEMIPPPGYYHIPYRSIRAKGFRNLLLGSRCISGTHEAHSSYRVMAPLCAIGQAAGVAAALTATLGKHDVRELDSAEIRHALHEQGAFVEGEMTDPIVGLGQR
jgi:hypothetical protein